MCEGKKTGDGKFYYENGKLWYEGNFKDDKFDGKNIKTYHSNGNLKFEGNRSVNSYYYNILYIYFFL